METKLLWAGGEHSGVAWLLALCPSCLWFWGWGDGPRAALGTAEHGEEGGAQPQRDWGCISWESLLLVWACQGFNWWPKDKVLFHYLPVPCAILALLSAHWTLAGKYCVNKLVTFQTEGENHLCYLFLFNCETLLNEKICISLLAYLIYSFIVFNCIPETTEFTLNRMWTMYYFVSLVQWKKNLVCYVLWWD